MSWRRRAATAAVAVAAIIVLAFAWVVLDEPRAFVRVVAERVTGNTPEAIVADYVSALTDRDESLALEQWSLRASAAEALVARRAAVTRQLLGTADHQLREVEWWSTCCMPSITTPDHAKYAGFARLTVDLDGARYIFDVEVAGHVSPFDDNGLPRTWLIRDVYPAAQQPLYWTWPGR